LGGKQQKFQLDVIKSSFSEENETNIKSIKGEKGSVLIFIYASIISSKLKPRN